MQKISSSEDVFTLMKPIVSDKSHEEFWVIYLNNSNKVLTKELCSKGGMTSTIVDIRLLYKRALELSAIGIIVCHNHPSGNVNPSEQDKILTDKVKKAGNSLDIQLLDHLVIGEVKGRLRISILKIKHFTNIMLSCFCLFSAII